PRTVKTYRGPRGGNTVLCGAKLGDEILLGTAAGAIYRTTAEEADEAQVLTALTENTYDKILDMAPFGEDFYFLTRNAVYQSSYDSGIVNRLGENPGQTQLITYGDKIILWSKGGRTPVQLFDYKKPELTTLFTPKATVQSVRLFNNKLVELESSTTVRVYDMDGGTLREVYAGAGLQDAVVAENGKLYVAKSFSTNPQSVLLCIDMDTKETVPMPMNGNVAFALNVSGNTLYGICVQSNDTAKKTIVFSFNTLAKRMAVVQQFSDEDPDAFAYLHYPALYTNVGKNQVSSINLATKKVFSFRRSASMPSKVAQNAARVVILNRDGSISWYNNNLSQVLADWYLTRDGQWFEF
ncbi:MAG: hypothetical protein K2H09_07645, partial [Treponemataceae bacterium]|nr:hypothetical protein [Treponemataceae bacterium]